MDSDKMIKNTENKCSTNNRNDFHKKLSDNLF